MNSWAMTRTIYGRLCTARHLPGSAPRWCSVRPDRSFDQETSRQGRQTKEVPTVLSTDGFFSRAALGSFGFRWLHILAGITWIGLLYYFNFVPVPAFAAFRGEARARNIAIDKVARRALWWFRWSAISTFVLGILITLITEDY